MDSQSLFEQLKKEREILEKLTKTIVDLPLVQIENHATLGLLSAPARFLIKAKNYVHLVAVLKLMRRKTGKPFPRKMAWYCMGTMLFSWEAPLIEIWYSCNPKEVPKELFPSANCYVEEFDEEPSKAFRLICPVDKKKLGQPALIGEN